MIRLLILFIPLLLWGDVDAQIEAIQKASVQERYKLMNAFKNKLIKMREKERIQALQKLQKKTNTPVPNLKKKHPTEELEIEELRDIGHNETENEREEPQEEKENE